MIETGQDLNNGGVVNAVFWERTTRERMRTVVSACWPVEATDLRELGPLELTEVYSWNETGLYLQEGVAARVVLENSQLSVRVAAVSKEHRGRVPSSQRPHLVDELDGAAAHRMRRWLRHPVEAAALQRRL